jgi:uncharacterized protein YjbJ (UPF0337 family)
MKMLPWMVAGAGLGFAAYVLLTRSDLEYATGLGNTANAARRVFGWGTRQRVSGAGGQLSGRLKEGAGRIIGDDSLAGEGIADQATGQAKDAAGSIAQAVGQTIHEFSR